MVKYSLEERINRARQLHKEGYNCSQCVFMVFDDVHEMDLDIATRVSSGFGGGVGGQRQVCGAVSGMTMVLGMTKFSQPTDKPSLYKTVQDYSSEFKELNGSIVCGELLKPGRKPCMSLIEDAITIIHNKL